MVMEKREIKVASLEQGVRRRWTEKRRNDWDDLHYGRAVLKLPDGTRWYIPMWGRPDELMYAGEFNEPLFNFLMVHYEEGRPNHSQHSWPDVYFEEGELNLHKAFCACCQRFISLPLEVMGKIIAGELPAPEEVA
jgi:hypothetical protein